MKKLTPKLRVTELDTLVLAICRHYEADASVQADGYLNGVMTDLKVQSAQLSASIRQDKAYSMLEDADELRDDVLRDFGTILDGYAALPIAAKRAAAQRILSVYAKYRATIIRESYANESSLIESLLHELQDASFVPAIATLEGISETLQALRDAQDGFHQAHDAYVDACTQKAVSASSLKKPLIALINDTLLPDLNAMQRRAPDTVETFLKRVEEEISRMNDAVKLRYSKK